MNKTDLIDAVAKSTKLSKKDSENMPSLPSLTPFRMLCPRMTKSCLLVSEPLK
jgi:hypothetical protein